MSGISQAVEAPLETPVMQHTPGPWRLSAPGDICYVTGPDGQYILKRDSKKTWDKVAASRITADCRLIAAAPDLLMALRELLADDDVTMMIGTDATDRLQGLVRRAVGAA